MKSRLVYGLLWETTEDHLRRVTLPFCHSFPGRRPDGVRSGRYSCYDSYDDKRRSRRCDVVMVNGSIPLGSMERLCGCRGRRAEHEESRQYKWPSVIIIFTLLTYRRTDRERRQRRMKYTTTISIIVSHCSGKKTLGLSFLHQPNTSLQFLSS